jgi:hypothetical protein
VTFDGYAQPATSGLFQYIVKATAHTAPAAPAAPVLTNVRGFAANGIRLGVTNAAGAAIPIAQLATIEMSIEVTRYAS